MRGAAERLLSGMARVEGIVAALSYALVAGLLLADVIAREVLAAPLLGAGQIAVLAAIVAGFLGLSLATAADRHLRTEALSRLLPARWDPVIGRLSDGVSALVYLVLAGFAILFVVRTQAAGDRAAVLLFPLWPVQLVLPYAFLSCGLRHALRALLPGGAAGGRAGPAI